MLTQLLSIARNAFVEGLRQPVFLILVLVSGLCQLMTTWSTGFTMGYDETAEVAGDNKLMLDLGLATIFAIGTLLAAFIATAVMSREIENKTVLTVVSKPVSRTVLVLGKYVGVSGAILIAVVTMVIFLMFGIRHGVMSTAADTLDGPVLVFSLSAIFLSLFLAAWCNFFYGWSFPQTAVVLMLPLCFVAYVFVLALGKQWQWQPLGTDFKPQITLAALCLVIAIMVLTAAATAASTRFSQVTTIVICVGLFVASLLSNYFIGRYAFENRLVGVISTSVPEDPTKTSFRTPGETILVELQDAPKVPVKPGDSFYYGPDPSGAFLVVPKFDVFEGNLAESSTFLGPTSKPAVIVSAVNGKFLTVRNVGAEAVKVSAPPRASDYVFLRPTKVRWPAFLAWAALPNLQYFWLLDAVSQNYTIPPAHVLLVGVYGATQIMALLSVAVILFQRRDVG